MTHLDDTTPPLTAQDEDLIRRVLPEEHRLVRLLAYSFPGWTAKLFEAARREGEMRLARSQVEAARKRSTLIGHPDGLY